jgi:hypothetical protein
VALLPTTLQELFMPQYRDIFAVPVFAHMFNCLIMSRMGAPKGRRSWPMATLMASATTSPSPTTSRPWAHTYCQRGVSVQFHEYQGLDHRGG